MRHKLIAGNWKMNGLLQSTRKLLFQLAVEWGKECEGVEVAVCPPFTSLLVAKHELELSHIKLGAQNCYVGESGAFTGEIAPAMLADLGCTFVILGHSERRTIFGESSELVSRKAHTAIEVGLRPIICIGETESEREMYATESVLRAQLTGSLAGLSREQSASVVLAYEPVWAIGTGKAATTEQVAETHHFIREEIRLMFGGVADEIQILYGGSVKPANAFELFSLADVDGGLIGGASLAADQFIDIIEAGARACAPKA